MTDDPATTLQRQNLFGLEFIDATGFDEITTELLALKRLAKSPDEVGGAATHGPDAPIVVTPNVDHLVKLHRRNDPVADAVVHSARYVLPDGQPIVWASRWLHAPLRARLTGSSLVARLWPALVAQQRPVLVIASSDEIAGRITEEYPEARCVVAPRLPLDDPGAFERFIADCIALPAATTAEFVFVTLGFPRQERLIAELRRQWPVGVPMPVCCAIGASFEMYYGIKKRAPAWVQRLGAEWLFRFLQEPRRLFRRYFIDSLAFPRIVLAERRRRSG